MQDINFSETCRFADVVLPAAASLEKEGTFTSTERRIQRIYKAMEPLGESKPDWEIIQLIANRMGADWNYTHPSEIMDEVAAPDTHSSPASATTASKATRACSGRSTRTARTRPSSSPRNSPSPTARRSFYPIE